MQCYFMPIKLHKKGIIVDVEGLRHPNPCNVEMSFCPAILETITKASDWMNCEPNLPDFVFWWMGLFYLWVYPKQNKV